MLPQVARRGRNRSESRLNTRGHTSQVRMNATARLLIVRFAFHAVELCLLWNSVCKRRRISPLWSTGLIDGIQQFFRASLDSTDSSAPCNFHCNSDHWQHDPCVGRPGLVPSLVSEAGNATICGLNLGPSELMKARSITVHCVANLCFPLVVFIRSSPLRTCCLFVHFTQTCVWITKKMKQL